MTKLNNFLRIFYNKYNQKRLKNNDISLIASNCNGGVILHDLNLKFNSPFVNLWIKPKDFIRFCENMPYYLKQDIFFAKEEGINYPIGLIDDVKIYFQHYSSDKEAEEQWNKRRSRVNMNNIFILFTDRDGCTYKDLERFDGLKYKNKVVFTHKKYPEINSAVFIPGFENQDSVGMCMAYKNKITFKRYLDSFDYVSWFNNGKY